MTTAFRRLHKYPLLILGVLYVTMILLAGGTNTAPGEHAHAITSNVAEERAVEHRQASPKIVDWVFDAAGRLATALHNPLSALGVLYTSAAAFSPLIILPLSAWRRRGVRSDLLLVAMSLGLELLDRQVFHWTHPAVGQNNNIGTGVEWIIGIMRLGGLYLSILFLLISTTLIKRPPAARIATELIRRDPIPSGAIILSIHLFTTYALPDANLIVGQHHSSTITQGAFLALIMWFLLSIPYILLWSQRLQDAGIPPRSLPRIWSCYAIILTLMGTLTAVIYDQVKLLGIQPTDDWHWQQDNRMSIILLSCVIIPLGAAALWYVAGWAASKSQQKS